MQVGAIGNSGAGRVSQTDSPQLVKAAHEFEAQMMKELLKPVTGQDQLTGEDDGDVDGGATGAMGEFASEALGQALSQAGGFGIADRVLHELSHSGHGTGTGKVTANRHGNRS